MRTLTDLVPTAKRPDTLLVLLPPALSTIDDLCEQGFVDAVRRRQLPVDVLLADINGQDVLNKSTTSLLHTEVMQPAMDSGYRSIWLAGISLGAFSSLYYAAHHADMLTGLYLLSPYPGTNDVLAEIEAAGGAAAWSQTQTSTLDERKWWQWLAHQSLQSHWTVPVYFGTGSADRFIRGQRLMSALLPHTHVRTLPGAHQWCTWKSLWEQWLDSLTLCRKDAQSIH